MAGKKVKQANNGLLRDFDLKQNSVRLVYTLILVIGIITALAGIAPLIWLILSGFKDIREFVREPSILPKIFNFDNYIRTWNDLRFIRYFRNSFI